MSGVPFNHDDAASRAVLVPVVLERLDDAIGELDAACLVDGVLQPMPAAFYASREPSEVAAWCVARGFYCLPTVELIDWLREQIGDESAIEVGAGHGAIGRALGIPITDSRQQERPEVAATYRALGQPPVSYPADVETLTALEAVEKYRPSVVVAAWTTWRYDARAHHRGGNVHGIDESKLLGKRFVRRYIQVEHARVHARRPIQTRRHAAYTLPFLWSRSVDRLDVVRIWGVR
jgi:hypothetical protein